MIHFLLHWSGLDNASGPQYLFWSGIFGDVTIITSIVYAVKMWRKHRECHEPTCHKHGKFEFHDPRGNVTYKLCEDHHPGVPVGGPTHLHLAKIHKENQ